MTEDGDMWMVNQIDLWTTNSPPRFVWDGFVLEASKWHTTPETTSVSMYADERAKEVIRSKDIGWRSTNIGSRIPLSIYLTLMLNSRSTDKFREPAPERLNKARKGRGLGPLYDHTVVNLAPARYIDHGGEGGERRPPRLHWRRSHKRHFAEKPINAERCRWMEHEVWDGRVGWWVTVVPRACVGAGSPSEVTHEYRVHLDRKENVT